METEDIIIHIDWEGPQSLDAVAKLDGSTDRGVYQIYGSHPVYGSGVLLYIGRTRGTFAERVLTHQLYRNNPDAGHVEVYIVFSAYQRPRLLKLGSVTLSLPSACSSTRTNPPTTYKESWGNWNRAFSEFTSSTGTATVTCCQRFLVPAGRSDLPTFIITAVSILKTLPRAPNKALHRVAAPRRRLAIRG
jgi:hypothetical protein